MRRAGSSRLTRSTNKKWLAAKRHRSNQGSSVGRYASARREIAEFAASRAITMRFYVTLARKNNGYGSGRQRATNTGGGEALEERPFSKPSCKLSNRNWSHCP